MITSLIGSLIIGLIIGGLARLLLPGRDPMGCFMTALLGIAGSFVGGLIGRVVFGARDGQGYLRPSFLLSLLGAMILLWVWRKFSNRSQ